MRQIDTVIQNEMVEYALFSSKCKFTVAYKSVIDLIGVNISSARGVEVFPSNMS